MGRPDSTSKWPKGRDALEWILSRYGTIRVATLTAFLDESIQPGKPEILSVAALLFDYKELECFNAEWKEALATEGLDCFHMVDRCHRLNQFKHISEERLDVLTRRLIHLIRVHADSLLMCSVDSECYNNVLASSPHRNVLVSQYSLCLVYAIERVSRVNHKEDWNPEDKILYIYDRGGPHRGTAKAFLEVIKDDEELRTLYRMNDFIDRDRCEHCGLQAADIVAYEWALLSRRTLDRNERPVRGSLRSLLENSKWARIYFNEANLGLRVWFLYEQFYSHMGKLEILLPAYASLNSASKSARKSRKGKP